MLLWTLADGLKGLKDLPSGLSKRPKDGKNDAGHRCIPGACTLELPSSYTSEVGLSRTFADLLQRLEASATI